MSRDRTDLQVLFTHIVADRSARLVSEQRRVVSVDLCRSLQIHSFRMFPPTG